METPLVIEILAILAVSSGIMISIFIAAVIYITVLAVIERYIETYYINLGLSWLTGVVLAGTLLNGCILYAGRLYMYFIHCSQIPF